MSFLLDTDICSAYLKGNREVGNRVVQHFGGLYISAITLGELYTWALRSKAPPQRLTVLEAFLTDVLVLELTSNVAREFGRIRAELLDQGLPAPDMDLLIATTAIVYDFTLITHNTKDYANVRGLRLLDWVLP